MAGKSNIRFAGGATGVKDTVVKAANVKVKSPKNTPTGVPHVAWKCQNCNQPLPSGMRFCDSYCRKEYEQENS